LTPPKYADSRFVEVFCHTVDETNTRLS